MIYKKVIAYLQELLLGEITFYIGPTIISLLNKELKTLNGVYTVPDINLDFISIAAGLAMTTTKKVNIVMDDNYLFKNFNVMLQAAAGRCPNLFLFVLVTKKYEHALQQVNLYNSVRSIKGSIYEMGYLTHIHTRFFKNKVLFNKFKKLYYNMIGPAVGIIEVNNINDRIDTTWENDAQLFIDFVRFSDEANFDEIDAVVLKLKES